MEASPGRLSGSREDSTLQDDSDEIEIVTLAPTEPEEAPQEAPEETEEDAPEPLEAAPFDPSAEDGWEVVSIAPTQEAPSFAPEQIQAATEADRQLNGLLHTFQEYVTQIAQLVHRIRSQELYRALGYETFEAYIRSKELNMSRSFIYQLAKVGEVIEKAGVDPALPAARELQISKLAQIARLPDAEEQKRVLETGKIMLLREDGVPEEKPLNEVKVKDLNRLINERLGRAPKIEPAYDPDPEPSFKPTGVTPGIQNAAAYEATYTVHEATREEWREALDTLLMELRKLPGDKRQLAITEITETLRGLATMADVPF